MRKEPEHDAVATATASLPMKSRIILKVNGADHQLEVAPWTTLLDALREDLDLTGSKKGCDHGQCGACTVLVNGKRINACLTLAIMKDGAESGPRRDRLGHRYSAGRRERARPRLWAVHES